MKKLALALALCLPGLAWTQSFTDVTPVNVPAMDDGAIAWADYNNDGYLDFALSGVGSSGSRYGGIFTNLGNGNFLEMPISSMAMQNPTMDWGDFDEDGDLDIIMTGGIAASPYDITRVFRNDLTSFSLFFETEGSGGGGVTWLDYDNDGDLDFYQVGYSADNWYRNSIFVNDGHQFNEAFDVKGYQELDVLAVACVSSDFDNDGDLDLVASGKYTYGIWPYALFMVNNGIKNVEHVRSLSYSIRGVEVKNGSISTADFNKDGHWDYLFTGNNSGISNGVDPISKIVTNPGDRDFFISAQLTGVYTSDSDVADIDNDGDQDIIIAGLGSSGPLTQVYINQDGTNFTPALIPGLINVKRCDLAFGDYDNDGDPDLLLCGRDANDKKVMKLYRNDLRTTAMQPNHKPSAPLHLRHVVQNNEVTLQWDAGGDTETAVNALSYNFYLGQSPQQASKFFPQANLATGLRKVAKPGNASTNLAWTLKQLDGGDYYYAVQTIDGAFAGSTFANESAFKLIRIDPVDVSCAGTTQQFKATPAGNYTWTVSGGSLAEGQGTDLVKVKWGTAGNGKISVTDNFNTNAVDVTINPLPSPKITGLNPVCGPNGYLEYTAGPYDASFRYDWIADGKTISNTPEIYITFTGVGKKSLSVTKKDLTTGCANTDTLKVLVTDALQVDIMRRGDSLISKYRKDDYQYTWEWQSGSKQEVVGTKEAVVVWRTGQYTLTVKNGEGCISKNYSWVNEIVTGLESQQTGVRVFPNPVNGKLKIENLPVGRPVKLSLSDIVGQKIFEAALETSESEIDCSFYPAGVYMLNVKINDRVTVFRIAVE